MEHPHSDGAQSQQTRLTGGGVWSIGLRFLRISYKRRCSARSQTQRFAFRDKERDPSVRRSCSSGAFSTLYWSRFLPVIDEQKGRGNLAQLAPHQSIFQVSPEGSGS